MEGWFLLDVIVRKGSAVFQLFSSEDESLLIGRDSFFVLDLGLYVLNGVRGLNVQGNSFTCEGLYEDLHLDLLVV